MENLLMSWGLRYLKAGCSIIPIQTKSKLPLIDWKEFQTRRASEVELRSWLQKWPEMNLGIVTGSISNLAVVDLDGLDGLNYMKQQKLVSGIISKTGNGKQVFYKCAPNLRNSVRKFASGVDVRGEGGYVVVAPSIHPSGRTYRWERFVPDLIPDFPTELLRVTNTEKAAAPERSDDWLSEALEEMKNGHIHNTLVSVLGKFRAHNFSEFDTVAAISDSALKGGMSMEELKAKVAEIWGRYPAGAVSSGTGASKSYSLYDIRPNSELHIKSPRNADDFEQFNATLQRQSDMDNGRKLSSGFPTLDRYLEGGLKSERLFTVAARTGTGKTNFAIALASNLCQQGKKVLFFSTEFQYNKIWQRYIATLRFPDEFRKHSFYVCDSFSPNISQVEEALKQMMPDVFIFDHINQLGEEREGLGIFMQGANFLQRKYSCQGVMVAQLNRQADWVEAGKRVEPRMSMIKGSGTIEQASSRVLLLSETRISPEYNEILGVLDKNDSGDRGLINFALYKSPYTFKELI